MSTVSRASEGDDAPDLLPWLARVTDDPALESRVALRHLGDARGRCLVALRNLTPDEVIFNVPFSLVFAEREDDARDDEDHLPWSACMAVRLLEERAAKGPLLPWIQSSPSRVSTAPLEYDDASLEACHDPAVIAEARDVATAHARAAERLAPRLAAADADADDLRAAGALHSRCFTHGPRGTHLAVPGVDMCNHRASNPTAVVRVVASPDACQDEPPRRRRWRTSTPPRKPSRSDTFNFARTRRAWRRAKRCASATDPGRTIRSFCISGSCPRKPERRRDAV